MASKLKTTIYSIDGEKSGEMELPASIFGREMDKKALSQTVVALQKNMRTSRAHAKGRSEVSGGGRKPWRQKGTGRARHGSIRSPIWRGGGATHGPLKQRKHQVKINSKAKAGSLAIALSAKLKDKEIIVVEKLKVKDKKTKTLKKIVDGLVKKDGSVKILLATKSYSEDVIRSSGNIPNVSVVEARNLSVLDVLSSKYIIFEKEAIQDILKKRLLS